MNYAQNRITKDFCGRLTARGRIYSRLDDAVATTTPVARSVPGGHGTASLVASDLCNLMSHAYKYKRALPEVERGGRAAKSLSISCCTNIPGCWVQPKIISAALSEATLVSVGSHEVWLQTQPSYAELFGHPWVCSREPTYCVSSASIGSVLRSHSVPARKDHQEGSWVCDIAPLTVNLIHPI